MKTIYSIFIVFLCQLIMMPHAYAREKQRGEALLADIRSPFIKKLPRIIKQVQDDVSQIRETISDIVPEEQYVEPPSVVAVVPEDDFEYHDEQEFNDYPARGNAYDQSPPAVPQTPLNIVGVIWSDDDPMAIINNQVVGVGDHFSMHKVLRIMPSKVVLLNQQTNTEISLEINDSGPVPQQNSRGLPAENFREEFF